MTPRCFYSHPRVVCLCPLSGILRERTHRPSLSQYSPKSRVPVLVDVHELFGGPRYAGRAVRSGGWTPDSAQCGCITSMGLTSVDSIKVAGPIRIRHLVHGSNCSRQVDRRLSSRVPEPRKVAQRRCPTRMPVKIGAESKHSNREFRDWGWNRDDSNQISASENELRVRRQCPARHGRSCPDAGCGASVRASRNRRRRMR